MVIVSQSNIWKNVPNHHFFVPLCAPRCLSLRRQRDWPWVNPNNQWQGATGTGKLSKARVCRRKGSGENCIIHLSVASLLWAHQGTARQLANMHTIWLSGLQYLETTEIPAWRRISRRTLPNHRILSLNPICCKA